MINATIIADSINDNNDRLTTFVLEFPRWILAEINTHRTFSRNVASSRAIPIKKMIEIVMNDPAVPHFYGKNQSGMQSKEELTGESLSKAKEAWLKARDRAIESAEDLSRIGLHKQYVNRTIENFMYIKAIVSATEYGNFFALRAHQDAQPEFQALAYLMLEKYNTSIPTKLPTGQWHIPFGDRMPEGLTLEQKLKIATARCARTSYLTFDGEINLDKDYKLHDDLASSGHWSPFEHCAMAHQNSSQSGNFKGWHQYRKTFYNENKNDERIKQQ